MVSHVPEHGRDLVIADVLNHGNADELTVSECSDGESILVNIARIRASGSSFTHVSMRMVAEDIWSLRQWLSELGPEFTKEPAPTKKPPAWQKGDVVVRIGVTAMTLVRMYDRPTQDQWRAVGPNADPSWYGSDRRINDLLEDEPEAYREVIRGGEPVSD